MPQEQEKIEQIYNQVVQRNPGESEFHQAVREVIDSLTVESLAAGTKPVEGPGWPRPVSYPVRTCLRVVLNEEWEHHLYANRDLAVLEEGLKN